MGLTYRWRWCRLGSGAWVPAPRKGSGDRCSEARCGGAARATGMTAVRAARGADLEPREWRVIEAGRVPPERLVLERVG